jgi:hypothetical protein
LAAVDAEPAEYSAFCDLRELGGQFEMH